jgi:hypothetical protein
MFFLVFVHKDPTQKVQKQGVGLWSTMPGLTKLPAEYVADIKQALLDASGSSTFCCGMQCLKRLDQAEVEEHLVDVATARSSSYSGWWFWVRSLYFNLLPMVRDRQSQRREMIRGSRVVTFRLPAITRPLCQTAFVALLGIGSRTLRSHCPKVTDATAATPPDHGHRGREAPNQIPAVQRSAVVHFVQRLAEKEGVPNPRFILDRTSEDQPDNIKHIIHLPPCYTKNSIFIKYVKSTEVEGARVGRSSFMEILKRDDGLANIKFSKRTRGLCELCKDLRLSLQRSSSNERATSVMEELRKHLQAAHDLRTLYKERQRRAIHTWPLRQRAAMAMISFDYAVQLTLPVSSMETQNEYMATRFGLDVNLFGISNESAKEYHNILYTEGYKHGAEHVISMVHFYFDHQPRVGNAKQLMVYTDSCSGQNRNKFVHAYFVHRVCAGFHEEICWNFMAVGHTKFSPDRGFALIRNAQAKHDIYTMDDWLKLVNNISPTGEYRSFGYEMPDECFRRFKELFDGTGLKAITGIKVLNIAEIRYRAVVKDGVRQCIVDYLLAGAGEEERVEVSVLKTRLSKKDAKEGRSLPPWPDGSLLKEPNLPSSLPRTPLSFDRWNQLMVNVERFVGITEEQLQWWEELPHAEGSKKGKRKRASERASSKASKGKTPEPPTTSTSSSSASAAPSRAALLAKASPEEPTTGRYLSRLERAARSLPPGAKRGRGVMSEFF